MVEDVEELVSTEHSLAPCGNFFVRLLSSREMRSGVVAPELPNWQWRRISPAHARYWIDDGSEDPG